MVAIGGPEETVPVLALSMLTMVLVKFVPNTKPSVGHIPGVGHAVMVCVV